MNELLEITLGAALREQAAKRPDNEFLVYPNRGVRHTCSGFDKQVDSLAKGLLAAGFTKGDHIGIWANNVPEWAVIFFAAARVGIVTVPLNISFKAQELGYIINQADLKGLFMIERFRDVDCVEMFYRLIPELKNYPVGSLKSERLPHLKAVVNISNSPRQGLYTLDDIINMGSKIDDAVLKKTEVMVDNTDVACIIYTSGTTGLPKGAMLTHRNLLNNGPLACRTGMISQQDVLLNVMPFFYISTFALVIANIVHGFKMVCPEGFDPLFSLSLIEKEGCTWIGAVPTMYIAMMSHPRFNEFSLKSLHSSCIGGAACLPEVMNTIIARFHLKRLYLAYGLTETSPFITDCILEAPDDERIATVGSPIPGMEVSIRDANNAECPVNIQGEICARGYHVMKGYYKMEEATSAAIDKENWFHTGDLGHLLPNGCLVIDGRIKDMIVRGGEKVYPREVEYLLLTMPGVKDVQVTGIPSQKYGEEVGAFIIPKEGAVIGENDVAAFCREKISFFKMPKYVFFVDAFPLSGSGKVQKFKLSEEGLKQAREKGLAT